MCLPSSTSSSKKVVVRKTLGVGRSVCGMRYGGLAWLGSAWDGLVGGDKEEEEEKEKAFPSLFVDEGKAIFAKKERRATSFSRLLYLRACLGIEKIKEAKKLQSIHSLVRYTLFKRTKVSLQKMCTFLYHTLSYGSPHSLSSP